MCFFVVALAYASGVRGQELHDGLVYGRKSDGAPSAASDYIKMYQRYLSEARGSRCAMFPSCSNYGLRVFSKKPFVVAMAMTADRMIRCGHDGDYYPLTYEYGCASLVDLPPFDSLPPHLVYRPTSYVVSGEDVCRNATDSIVGFVRHMINSHHYQSALLEIERIGYFHPELRSPSLYLQKMFCYDGLDREEEGLLDFYYQGEPAYRKDNRLLFQAAKMYGELGNHKEAANMLAEVSSSGRDTLYRKFLCLGIATLRSGEEEEAFGYIKRSAAYAPDVASVTSNLRLMLALERKKRKSPLVAGLLSVVPGCGYVYNRQPASALTALIVNGLLAYATYTSVKRKNYGLAGVMGVFGFTFYTGNILGSVSGAKRYNERRLEDCASSIEKANNIHW